MELNDLQFQRQGIAPRLMDMAEQLIATRSRKAGITVGLLGADGPAQRLYARRGYVPDGRSACQGERPLKQGVTGRVGHGRILPPTNESGYFDCTPSGKL